MIYFLLFLFGSAIGSFLNVVSMRYQPDGKMFDIKTIGGRSACPNCRKILKWYELVPLLSFIVQFGKCRGCGSRLSFQYPLVELLSGMVFVFVPLAINNNFSPPLVVGCWLLIFTLFILLSVIDFRHYIIPDRLNLSLAAIGAVLAVFKQISNFNYYNYSFFGNHYALFLLDFPAFHILDSKLFFILNYSFAALSAMAFFAAVIILTKGRAMGWGDFKLAGALGMIFGWPDILLVLTLAFIVGGAAVMPLLVRRKKTMKDIVPFGPFLVIGASLVFFFGNFIVDWYFKLFDVI